MGAGENAIIAGLMCDILKKTSIDIKEVEESLSADVAAVVKGVSDFQENSNSGQDDIMLVKLAERLHNMRTLKYMDADRWKTKARETVDIYMPIARKLGIMAMIEELNKLAVEYA